MSTMVVDRSGDNTFDLAGLYCIHVSYIEERDNWNYQVDINDFWDSKDFSIS